MPSLSPEDYHRIPNISSVQRRTCTLEGCGQEMSVHQATKHGIPFKFTLHTHASANDLHKYPEEVLDDKTFHERLKQGSLV